MSINITAKTIAIIAAVSFGIVAALFIAIALWGALMVS